MKVEIRKKNKLYCDIYKSGTSTHFVSLKLFERMLAQLINRYIISLNELPYAIIMFVPER